MIMYSIKSIVFSLFMGILGFYPPICAQTELYLERGKIAIEQEEMLIWKSIQVRKSQLRVVDSILLISSIDSKQFQLSIQEKIKYKNNINLLEHKSELLAASKLQLLAHTNRPKQEQKEAYEHCMHDVKSIRKMGSIDPSKLHTLPTPLTHKVNYACLYEVNPEKNLIAISHQNLFTHTDEKLEIQMQGEDFLKGDVRLIKAQKKYYLDIKLQFASNAVKLIYGNIEPKTPTRFLFTSEESILIVPHLISAPTIDIQSGNTIYNLQYPLSKEQIKLLAKRELNKIGFLWTMGYEEYDVHQLDLIKDMYICLSKN